MKKTMTFHLAYHIYNAQGEGLSTLDKELVERAKEATRSSYAPYSHFQVGAAVLLENGDIVAGSNQENAAFSPTMCAERTAIFYANAEHPGVAPTTMAIAAWRESDQAFLTSPITPCGVCRQVLLEVEARYQKPLRLLLYGREMIYEIASASDLMPLRFTGEALV